MMQSEPILEPDLPICDPHHHLWDLPEGGGSPLVRMMRLPRRRFLLDELLGEIGAGHNIVSTVFIQARAFHRASGPEHLMPVGETEVVNGVAAMAASGRYGDARICAGIVSYADLTLGDVVAETLAAHLRAGGGRVRGIRQSASHDAAAGLPRYAPHFPDDLYRDPAFRAGFARLAEFGLSFDAWLYHPQIDSLTELADAFPDQPIVLDHLGTPLGIGPYAGRGEEVFAHWRASLRELARRPNVRVKLGGLGMVTFDPAFSQDREAVTSERLAVAWRPYIETGIEAFGIERSMFESNFPVDEASCGYAQLWNAFKRIASGCSPAEKDALFRANAEAFYRIEAG